LKNRFVRAIIIDMKSVVINGKKYLVEDNSSLKTLLKELGFTFPCGGEGKCGRCRITCNEIKATALDSRFLNEKQLVGGIRLACDKKVEDNYDIKVDPELFGGAENVKKLSECRVSAVIGSQNVTISILDTDIVETVTLKNPLTEYGNFSAQAEKYPSDRATFSKLLRNCIGKESVELFEKYGAAKADTLSIAGNEFYIKALMGIPLKTEVDDYNELAEDDNLSLPTELVYVLPVINSYIGGDILCETVELKENSLLIDCGDICAFAYIGEEENTLAAMWDMTYTELELSGIKAAVRTIMKGKEGAPAVYLYGENAGKVAPIIEELNLTHIENPSKRIENAAKACLNSRFRAKLNKEKARSVYLDILGSETFHENFARNEYKTE